jgi:hypothetical protein
MRDLYRAASFVLLGRARKLFLGAIVLWTLISAGSGWAAPVYNPVTGHYYEAVAGGFSWEQANAAAQSVTYLGARGHLATITTAAENQFLVSMFPEVVPGHYWLGGFQAAGVTDPAAGWQWVTGEPWSYTNWAPGEPNDFLGPESEDKLGFHPDYGGEWNDAQSPWPSGFVIEYEPTATQAIQSVIAQINNLVSIGALTLEEAKGLIAKLEAAIQKLQNPGIASTSRARITASAGAVINQLEAFIHQVEAFVRARKLTAAQGQQLISLAQAIIVQIGG